MVKNHVYFNNLLGEYLCYHHNVIICILYVPSVISNFIFKLLVSWSKTINYCKEVPDIERITQYLIWY